MIVPIKRLKYDGIWKRGPSKWVLSCVGALLNVCFPHSSFTAHERFHDINRFLCTSESISNATPQLCCTDSDVCWETERLHHRQCTRDNTFNKTDRRGTGIKLQGHSWVTSHSGIPIWPALITKTINETEWNCSLYCV